jgi:hypothetical protein
MKISSAKWRAFEVYDRTRKPLAILGIEFPILPKFHRSKVPVLLNAFKLLR